MDEAGALVEKAVLESVTATRSDGLNPDIAGYALVVDESFRTVFGACITRASLDEGGHDALLFMPADWDREFHSSAFQRASASLDTAIQALGGASYEDRARAVSVALGDALSRARSRDHSLRAAFLIVTSLGAGDLWLVQEGRLVERLNGREAYLRWKAIT